MKQISKKALSLLLALVMVIALLPTIAFAAGGMTVTIGSKTVDNVEGKTVDIPITLANNPGITGANIEVKFDKTALELVNIEDKGVLSKLSFTGPDEGELAGVLATANENGAYTLGWLGMSASKENGVIAVLTFKVIAGAKAGDKALTKGDIDVVGSDGNTSVETTVVAGSVTLKDKVVAVNSVTLNKTKFDMYVGETYNELVATINPSDATEKTVTWKSSNANVATVDENGVVTAVSEGTAKITATAGGKTSKACTVTVAVPPCDHSAGTEHHEAVPATCTDKGSVEYYECKTCHVKFADSDCKTPIKGSIVIPATGHTVVKVDKVDPTCSAPGMKAHYECSVCGKWFSDKKGTKEIADAEKASYVIAADPDMHVYDIVKDSYKESDEGYYVEKFQCTKCGDSYWLASVDLRNVDVKLVQKGKGDLKNAKVEVTSTSVKTKEVMSFYYNDTANAGDTLSLPVFFNYSESATEAEAIAALKKDIAENFTFTVKAAATKSGWKFTTDKTYTVTVELDDAGKIVTKWVGSDNTEVSAEDTPTFTITGTKTAGGGNGGSGNGGSTTTDTTKTDGKKVESGKTFDAGIAMYVGLSVLSVTGGALVIGKKKERF